jgi:hypothetical protein
MGGSSAETWMLQTYQKMAMAWDDEDEDEDDKAGGS